MQIKMKKNLKVQYFFNWNFNKFIFLPRIIKWLLLYDVNFIVYLYKKKIKNQTMKSSWRKETINKRDKSFKINLLYLLLFAFFLRINFWMYVIEIFLIYFQWNRLTIEEEKYDMYSISWKRINVNFCYSRY